MERLPERPEERQLRRRPERLADGLQRSHQHAGDVGHQLRQQRLPVRPSRRLLIASPIGGTNVVRNFLYHEGRRGKKVPRKRQNGKPQ